MYKKLKRPHLCIMPAVCVGMTFLFVMLSLNLAAQTQKDTLSNPQKKTLRADLKHKQSISSGDYLKKHHVYVLDGEVITAEEYRAMSLSTLKHIKTITSKEDPTFNKYANEETEKVVLLTKAKNIEESMLDLEIDITEYPVMLVDGVEVSASEANTLDPRGDVIKIEIIKGNNSICKTFEPRVSGIAKFVTKSRKFLNEMIDAEKERLKKEEPQAKLDTSKMMVYLVDGVEVRNVAEYDINIEDIVSVDISKDKDVCNLFAPRTGGVVMITTKSKKLLGKIEEDARKVSMEAQEDAHRNRKGLIIIK